MRQKKSRFVMSGIVELALALMLLSGDVTAGTYKVLHEFKGTDGASPHGTLVFDAAGNVYGTTVGGGTFGQGTVFKLTPQQNGSWTESVLYSFCVLTNCADGAVPVFGVILDGAGNLFGTTSVGGSQDFLCDSFGCGVVFELTPDSHGGWTESVVFSFTGSQDQSFPSSGLVFDRAGNLYGETRFGGCAGPGGTVFKLIPNAHGGWSEQILSGCPGGGEVPAGGLTLDATGNLYGTTDSVANSNIVFEVTPGNYNGHALHVFSSTGDGRMPTGGLIFDGAGNLYGTTNLGGSSGSGVVFKLMPKAHGHWTERILHVFRDHPSGNPEAGLIFDAEGNLYGTTANDQGNGYGTVFKMTPQSSSGWSYTVLHTFTGTLALSPMGGVVLDKAGNLYGTASHCASGTGCQGVVFEITP